MNAQEMQPSADNEGRTAVYAKTEKQSKGKKPLTHDHKPYLSENGGICINYVSDGSSEEISQGTDMVFQQAVDPTIIPLGPSLNAMDTTPISPMPPMFGRPDDAVVSPTNKPVSNEVAKNPIYPNTEATHTTCSGEKGDVDSQGIGSPREDLEFEEMFEEYEEDPSEIIGFIPDDADLENDQLLQILDVIDTTLDNDILKADVPFTKEHLEAFLNDEPIFEPPTDVSDNSFHSIQDSRLSSSSTANKIGELHMEVASRSQSNSSKRKSKDENETDTASSSMGSKKPRFNL